MKKFVVFDNRNPWFNFQFALSSRINRINLFYLYPCNRGFENKPRRREKRAKLIIPLLDNSLFIKFEKVECNFPSRYWRWVWKKYSNWWCLPELQIVYQKPRFSFRLLFFPPTIRHALSASLYNSPLIFPVPLRSKFSFSAYTMISQHVVNWRLKRVVLLPRYRDNLCN